MSDQNNPVDVSRAVSRLDIMNNAANEAINEINRTGRLRVPVSVVFERGPDYLVELLAHICLLKRYAETASAQRFNEPITKEAWEEMFEIFNKSCHILPSGELM